LGEHKVAELFYIKKFAKNAIVARFYSSYNNYANIGSFLIKKRKSNTQINYNYQKKFKFVFSID